MYLVIIVTIPYLSSLPVQGVKGYASLMPDGQQILGGGYKEILSKRGTEYGQVSRPDR